MKSIFCTLFASSVIGTKLVHKINRRSPDASDNFRKIAEMAIYMSGGGNKNENPNQNSNFANLLAEFTTKYSNYGCYCWIDGPSKGVIGGGLTRDAVDHHCHELYKCYQCTKSDYDVHYATISPYTVDYTMENGKRDLDCSGNSRQTTENICLCDKRFAINIAEAQQNCQNNINPGANGDFCMSSNFKTSNGGGTFDPSTCKASSSSQSGSGTHSPHKCCGLYPNRESYGPDQVCCEETINGNKIWSITGNGNADCNGVVVESEKGNPSNYVVVS